MVIDVPSGVTSEANLRLTEVLYSPEVGYTLVSIGQLDEKGFTATFGGGKCTIQGPAGKVVGVVLKTSKGLYKVEHKSNTANTLEEITLAQLHRHMGHISTGAAKQLVSKGFMTGIWLVEGAGGDQFFCKSCVYAKATRKSMPKVRKGERATEFGAEVHSDLWGPAPIESRKGKRYFITFTDNKTHLTNLYLLKMKNNAFHAYLEYEAWVKAQLNAKIKVLHSDNGGEYTSKEFEDHLKAKGTTQKLTVHNTPQHNSVAEC